ncbi:protein-tyrosine phosphatase-like protein [Flagelloscypha sp. PMI_526]|nr:protein-tyrosine phosphatase-like protein [Flagelloscypha sp. PMI_526]
MFSNTYGQPDEILPGLWLTGYYTASRAEVLKERNITYVLTVLDDSFASEEDVTETDMPITRLKIPVDDWIDVDLLCHFSDTNKFIDEALEQGRGIVVHCMMGVSRSATVVIAYLMWKKSMTFEDALTHVKERRPVIDPNEGFRAQLRIYEQFGCNMETEEAKKASEDFRNKVKGDLTFLFKPTAELV